MNDGKGTSLILIHSQHGSELWNQIKEKCYYLPVELEMVIRRNKSLVQPARENPRRKQFFEDFENKGYSYVRWRYMTVFSWAFHKLFGMKK